MLWVKTFHIVFMVSWFAGLFYLPRIYVNLAQAQDPAVYRTLLGMARRLYRFVTPIALLAIGFGLWLYLGYGIGLGAGHLWMDLKLAFVVVLVIYHLMCRHYLMQFENETMRHGHVFFRWFNEIPVVLLVIITALVVIKPYF